MVLFQVPGEENIEALVAENSFISDIQLAIEAALDEASMTQAALARHLGVTEARVSQILSGNGKNLQARTIARIAHALGVRPILDFVADASGWISSEAEDSEADDAFAEGFSQWVATAYDSLTHSQMNDNLWTTKDAHPADGERLVAA